MSRGETDGTETIAPDAPGALPMRVSLAGHADAVTVTQVYCLQEATAHTEDKQEKRPAAWVDPALLANTGSSSPAQVKHTYLKVSEAMLEPSIAEYGQTVKLTARLSVPAEPTIPVVVVARNSKTGQVFCILAYAGDADKPGRNKQKEEAINGACLWNPDKPYVYNPSVALSRNRGEVTLTVVAPSKASR